MTVPTFLVVGAGRSGTTGLAEGLRTHPRVFVTTPKEPHYFALHGTVPSFRAPGDDATINRVAVTDRDTYLALYPEQHGYPGVRDRAKPVGGHRRRGPPRRGELAPPVALHANEPLRGGRAGAPASLRSRARGHLVLRRPPVR